MRLLTLASAVLAALPLISADAHTAHIYIQPIGDASAPVPLAEVTYDITAPDTAAMVTSYEAPELPETASLARIGLYDARAKKWTGSTSVASVENFSKGYSPHFLLHVDATKTKGDEENLELLGASLRGVRIDAGQTRDFGPQARLVLTGHGKQPELNKPVVLSPEGKKLEKEPEKTFLQKFVGFPWPMTIETEEECYTNMNAQVLVDDWHCRSTRHGRRRRRQIEMDDFSRSDHGYKAAFINLLVTPTFIHALRSCLALELLVCSLRFPRLSTSRGKLELGCGRLHNSSFPQASSNLGACLPVCPLDTNFVCFSSVLFYFNFPFSVCSKSKCSSTDAEAVATAAASQLAHSYLRLRS